MILPHTEIMLKAAVNRVNVIENVDTKTLYIMTGGLSYYEGKSSGPNIHVK
jgi:hypothetical protein